MQVAVARVNEKRQMQRSQSAGGAGTAKPAGYGVEHEAAALKLQCAQPKVVQLQYVCV